MNDDINWFDL